MKSKLLFIFNKIKAKLWFKPLLYCVFSIVCALLAEFTDDSGLGELVPKIEVDSVESLLKIISASMLVISTFAVGSMISAFTAASSTATPRSFKLVISDDVSQNALSAFIGSFIFSVVAQVALNNGYYGKAGIFTLFAITIIIFMVVILTFLRWVDRISRLGKLGYTIETIESTTLKSINTVKKSPYYQSQKLNFQYEKTTPIFCSTIGYIQTINLKSLQSYAEKNELFVTVNCQPGSFVTPNKPIAYLSKKIKNIDDVSTHFVIENSRTFEEDPRFGFIALSEIASRSLSPAVNDPGTAIAILGSHARLFSAWASPLENEKKETFDHLSLPTIQPDALFNDAFRPIARDGANNIEVMIRFQKSLHDIAQLGDQEISACARSHAKDAIERAKKEMHFEGDVIALEKLSFNPS